MKTKQIITLLCAFGIGLVATTSANAGLAVLYSTPNDVSELSSMEMLHSAPNDLPDLFHAEYFTWVSGPNEKIIGEVLMVTKSRDWTKESNYYKFINHRVGNNFAGQVKLMSRRSDFLDGKPQNFNMITDFGKLGFWNILSAYAETAPGTNQATSEFRIDPKYNDFNYDVTLSITTEAQTPAVHHSP
jgi:hypothetical protein